MLKTTTVGSYPRKDKPKDTLRKPTVSEEEALDMVQWAVEDQCNIGLDYITDGESYRENMYWFYQLRIDGVRSWHTEGYENLDWVLIDYVNIVVHIFNKDARKYYEFERLWSDGIVTKIKDKK